MFAQTLICVIACLLIFHGVNPSGLPPELIDYYFSKHLNYAAFLTFWLAFCSLLTFSLRLVYLTIKFTVGTSFATKTLHSVFSLLFPATFCFSTVSTCIYWPLLFINPRNLRPAPMIDKNIGVPVTKDLALHLVPCVSALLLSGYTRIRCTRTNIVFLLAVSLAYVGLSNYGHSVDGNWPYPFMRGYGRVRANVFFAVVVMSGMAIYLAACKVYKMRGVAPRPKVLRHRL